MCTEKNKPHVHAELIKAWADGAEIESRMRGYDGKWTSVAPSWHPDCDYRIKPIPKVKKYMFAYQSTGESQAHLSANYYADEFEFTNSMYFKGVIFKWIQRVDASVIEV